MTNKNELQTKKPLTIVEATENKIRELVEKKQLTLPSNYAVGNALKSAWLILQDTKDKNQNPVLEVCTKASIANALLHMCILGLNPAKTQGYFIPYGQNLTWMTSYMGKCAVLKRIKGIDTEPVATLMYQGDKIKLGFNELGEEMITQHETSWENKLTGIIEGVYATVIVKNGDKEVKRSAVLTKAEVEESWKGAKQKGYGHNNFRGEFFKKTAINRLSKMIISTSNDDDLLAEALVQNESEHYNFDIKNADTIEEVEEEIHTNANTGEVIGFTKEEVEEEAQPEEKEDVVEEYLKQEKKQEEETDPYK